jgi:hypothetical protein
MSFCYIPFEGLTKEIKLIELKGENEALTEEDVVQQKEFNTL